MKFIVSRPCFGFGYLLDTCPCEEAEKISVTKIEVSTFKSPEEFDDYYEKNGRYRDNWFDEGMNHRKNRDGFIVRDNGQLDLWAIDINSLDDLIKFQKKYGKIEINTFPYNCDFLELTIKTPISHWDKINNKRD